jgi:hypothetical protein
VTKKDSSPHTKSNTAAIVGGIIGGAAAICSVIGIVVFVRRRRRRPRPRSVLSHSSEDVSQVIMTPFNPIPSEATLDAGTWAAQQPLLPGDREAEMVALYGLSSTLPAVVQRSRPVAPAPVGLSGKELARLRAETLSSEQSQNPSTSNVSQSTSSPNAVDESSGATSSYDPRRLQSEVESLRREMDRLRTEGLVVTGAPPSYTEGDG